MSDERTPDQRLAAAAGRAATRRLIWWGIGLGGGCFGPLFGVVVFALGSLILLAGAGLSRAHPVGHRPPTLATPMSRPAEWLGTATKDASRWGVPNVVALAVLDQASDGQVYADRYYCANQQSAGEPCATAYRAGTRGIGYGLFGLGSHSGLIPKGQPVHSVRWNLSTGLSALARYLHAGSWQAGLTAFHRAVQTPAEWAGDPHYASQIRELVHRYDARPTLGAWALAPWSYKTGQFLDPAHQPEWVFVVGTEPTGPIRRHAWKPPTITRTINPQTGTVTKTIHRHDLTYQDLSEPVQIWGTTQSGHAIRFKRSSMPGAHIPVWSGGVVWGARVPLSGGNKLVKITAQWANGRRDTIDWPTPAYSP